MELLDGQSLGDLYTYINTSKSSELFRIPHLVVVAALI